MSKGRYDVPRQEGGGSKSVAVPSCSVKLVKLLLV